MFIQMDVYIFVNAKDIYNFERVISHKWKNLYPIRHLKIHNFQFYNQILINFS